MKLLAFRLGVSLLALAVGLTATSVWRNYHPLTLQQLSSDHFWYDGQRVRIHAILDLNDLLNSHSNGRDREFMAATSCQWRECGAIVRLNQDPNTLGLQTYNYEPVAGAPSAPHTVRFAEVEIAGEVGLNNQFGNCFGPRFIVENAKIEKVIATYQFESLEASLDWLKLNSH
jgi:hypothetical protein